MNKHASRLQQNRNQFSKYVVEATASKLTDDQQFILYDPQTSGGLVLAIDHDTVREFLRDNPECRVIGSVHKSTTDAGQIMIR